MSEVCTVPPAGWKCLREPGHMGACATTSELAELRERFAKRLGIDEDDASVYLSVVPPGPQGQCRWPYMYGDKND